MNKTQTKPQPTDPDYTPWTRFLPKNFVLGAQITDIRHHLGGAKVILENDEAGWFHISPEFINEYGPLVGGYLVKFDDGRLIYRPKRAFLKEFYELS